MKSWYLPLSVLAMTGLAACDTSPDELRLGGVHGPRSEASSPLSLRMAGAVVTAATPHIGELDVLRIALGKLDAGDHALLTVESPFGITLGSMDLPVAELHAAMNKTGDATRVIDTSYPLTVPPGIVSDGRFLANLFVCVDTDRDGMCSDELVDEDLGNAGIGDAHVVAFVPLVAEIHGGRVTARRMRGDEDGHDRGAAALEQTLANYEPSAVGVHLGGATVVLAGFAGGSAATAPTDESQHDPDPPDDASDEPQSDEPQSDEPQSDEPQSDEPQGDEPQGDEPQDDAGNEHHAYEWKWCGQPGQEQWAVHFVDPEVNQIFGHEQATDEVCVDCSLELCLQFDDVGDTLGHDDCMWRCGYAARTTGCFEIGTRIATSADSTLPVEQLMTGTRVMTADGRSLRVEKIVAGREHKPLVQLQTAMGTLSVTQDHPMVTDSGLTTAAELDLGDQLVVANGGLALVTSLASTVTTRPVFNIVLEGDAAADHLIIAEGIVTGDLAVQNELAAKRAGVGE